MNLRDMMEEAQRLSRNIDAGIQSLYEASIELAEAEHECAKATAIAWVEAPKGTVPFREAWVDSQVAEQNLRKHLAEARKTSSLEAVRSRRTQLSALQSMLAAYRAEAEMGRYGIETG